ncbi:MAG: PAS domain-containing sensor histidine kinase [Bdellovibrionota bacterium]
MLRRINNLATLYWKLKRENAQIETDRLAESVKFLDSLIEYLPNMVFVKDAKDLRFVRFNRAGENLLGYKREDLIGKNDYDFFPKDQADHFTQKDRAVLCRHSCWISLKSQFMQRWIKNFAHKKNSLYDEKGNPTFLLGISEDITEVKKAEHEKIQFVKEQAARLEAEKGIAIRDEFISIASHELKTPLTSLDLQFQIIKRWFAKKDYSVPSLEKLQKIFQDSFLQVQKLGVLLEDLLDVSRSQRGAFNYNFETVDILEVLEGAVSRLSSQARAMGSEIVWGTKESCVVFCDPFRIDQALTNLIVNSIKYGQGTPVRVSIEAKGDCAELLISDSGIGIAPENQKKIFERFARAVSFKSISGMGLGLFITKEIVEAHKGTIEVESALGKGASFKVRIPLKNE